MVGTTTALVAAAMVVAATTTAAAAAAASPATDAATAAAEGGLADAGKLFTLTPDCDAVCQADVAASLTARGCTNVAVLPTLRLASAVCEPAAAGGRAGRGMDSGASETALQRLPGVMVVEEDGLMEGEEPIAMDSADAEVPLKLPNGEDYFWGLDRGSGTHHDAAMERLAAVGVVPVVSAGNTGEDACERTPARSPYAITVANSDVDDTLWRSSSRGSCVNMIA
eukprot:contig_13570_g3254